VNEMKRTLQQLLFATFAATLVACSTRPPAPVIIDGRSGTPPPAPIAVAPPPVALPVPVQPPQPVVSSDQYASRRGDTWFSVARQFNLNPRDLAQWNNAQPDSPLREGQVIRIQGPVSVLPAPITATPIPVAPPTTTAGPAGDVKREPKAQKIPYSDEAYSRLTKSATATATAPRAAGPTPVAPSVPTQTTAPGGTLVPPAAAATIAPSSAPVIAAGPTSETDSISWQWPVAGKVSKKFSEGAVMKGIAVDGKSGTPIYAAAAGRVVYAGEGLRNYGKLVIVRHNDQYTSVYGHNSAINVKEGDSVKRGQKIAEMGNTETDATRLFFEIRRSGKQVDPEKFLPGR
jgi:lipoprotein NlpD